MKPRHCTVALLVLLAQIGGSTPRAHTEPTEPAPAVSPSQTPAIPEPKPTGPVIQETPVPSPVAPNSAP
jgi:hypothetical protein